MILTLEPGADVAAVARALVACGQWAKKLEGGGAVHFMIEAHSRAISDDELARIPGVAAVAKAASPHPRLDAQARTLEVAGVPFGHGEFPVLLAGPCSVESEERIREIAEQVAEQGATFLRGGAMKPRTSPYSFTGHGDRALRWLRDAADAHGLRVVTEALGQDDLDAVAEHADLIQIGSRNMQNFALLRAAGRKARPVLLKRGLSATIEEWLLAAEHLLVHGAAGVILCERGIRSFDPQTRNLLDLGAVSLLAHVHGLPVIVDPSHAAGRRDLIAPLSRAALAAGAAGLLIETHPEPAAAMSDGPQALAPRELGPLVSSLGVALAAARPSMAKVEARPEAKPKRTGTAPAASTSTAHAIGSSPTLAARSEGVSP